MKFKSTLPLLLLMIGLCASSARSQISFPRGSLSGPTTVAALPATGNSNLLYDVRDGNPDCGTGGGSTRIVCHWTGAAYEKVAAGSVLAASNFVSGLTSTATAAGTTTLTVASKYFQVFTGSTTQTVTLPVVTTLPQVGFSFAILNDSSGALTVNSSGGNLVQTVAAGARVTVTCKLLTGTTAASWDVSYLPATFGISNSAGANVVPKSDGTNLVASRITDNGESSINIDGGIGGVNLGDINGGTALIDVGGSDVGGPSASITASTESLAINGTSHTITATSAAKTHLNAATGVNVQGTNTNDAAASGFVGELLTAALASGSATSLTTATAKTIISVSLTAGDWDVWGVVDYVPAATTTTAVVTQGASATNNTLGADDTFTTYSGGNLTGTVLSVPLAAAAPTQRISLASTTTIYLVGKAVFAVSTMTAYGSIFARRVR